MKKAYQIPDDLLASMVIDYYSDTRNSLPVLSKKYGYNQTSISRRMRKAGYALRTNSTSQIGLQAGKNHPNYKHGKTVRSEYRRAKSSVKVCEWCTSTENLLVHHINHDHYDNRLDNLVKICQSCHVKHHNRHRWLNKLTIEKSCEKS